MKNLFKDQKVTKIFGTAGAGKTTRLINLIENDLNNGLNPKDIIFISFTNKAVDEMKQRCLSKFTKYKEEDFDNFRTLHSFCYKQYTGKKVMTQRDNLKIAEKVGVDMSKYLNGEDGISNKTGDLALQSNNLLRLMKIGFDKLSQIDSEYSISFPIIKAWKEEAEKYKKENHSMDFIDMLEKHNSKVDCQKIYVDEAQDLSCLQWIVIDNMIKETNCKEVVIAGDDDQTIYEWAGAESKFILGIKEDKKEILDISYRVPNCVYDLSRVILSKIRVRQEKEREQEKKEGKIIRIDNLRQIEFNKNESYLILVRNRYQIKQMEERLRKLYLLYIVNNKSVLEEPLVKAIKAYKRYMEGLDISKREAKALNKYNRHNKLTYQKDWKFYFNKTDISKLDYLEYVMNKYDEDYKPNIKISTIHQSKGGEADNVILSTDVSHNVFRNMHKDSEHRVWYVAVTRTKNKLYLLHPFTNLFYKI